MSGFCIGAARLARLEATNLLNLADRFIIRIPVQAKAFSGGQLVDFMFTCLSSCQGGIAKRPVTLNVDLKYKERVLWTVGCFPFPMPLAKRLMQRYSASS